MLDVLHISTVFPPLRHVCCTELRQETLVRTQAAKRSSQFEEGEDKVAVLEKQVRKVKSEKRAVEDVSYGLWVYMTL